MRLTLVALGAWVTVVGCGSSLTAPTVKGQPPEYVEPTGSASAASPSDVQAPLPSAPPSAEPAKPPSDSPSASPPKSPVPDGGTH